MLVQVDTDERKLGHAWLGTWHSFMPRPPPTDEKKADRAPFLYVMANKLLHRQRVQAVQERVRAMVSSNRRNTHAMLLHDRRVYPDECYLEWVAGSDGISALDVPMNTPSDVPPFHATHYFGKDTSHVLETHLATDFVQHLVAKPALELKAVEDEVKALDTMVRATENQLLQLERHGAKKLKEVAMDEPTTKTFASIDEEIMHVQHHRAWTELRIAVKLAHPQHPPPVSSDEAAIIAALENDLPTETEVLVKLDDMIVHEKKRVEAVQAVVDASRTELEAHQDQYTQLLALYSGETADNMYSQLVTTRLAVDEHKVACEAAEKKLRKHQAKLEQLDTVLKLYSGPIDEQRTYTQEEYATLSGLLHLHQHSFDELAVARSTRFKALDQESLEQPDQANAERATRKSFRTVAKRLLVQHQVLTQMRRSSSALLELKQHKWFIHRPSSQDTLGRVDETRQSADHPAALTKVASTGVVRAGLQQSLDHDNVVVAPSLVQAYRRSIMLLFDAERQMVANAVEAQRRAELESQESFVEVNPVTASHAATADDVARLDRARRRGTLAMDTVDMPDKANDKGDMRVNRTRETLRRILRTKGNDGKDKVRHVAMTCHRSRQVLMVLLAQVDLDSATPVLDDNDMPSLSLDDIDARSKRQIYGSRFEFANFTVAADSDDSSIAALLPGSSRIPQSARGGPMALWKADGAVASIPASALSFVNKNVHETHVTQPAAVGPQRTSPPKTAARTDVPPLQRASSTRSPVRHRHSTVEGIPDRDEHRQRRRLSCATPVLSLSNDAPEDARPDLPHLQLDAAKNVTMAIPHPSSRTRRNLTPRSELVQVIEVAEPKSEPQDSHELRQGSPQDPSETDTPPDPVAVDMEVAEMSILPPVQPEESLPPPNSDLDAALDDVDALLDNFTTFSQTLLLRQYVGTSTVTSAVQESLASSSTMPRPRVGHLPLNATAVPLRSMDDILQRDESLRQRRLKTKQKYPKRTTSTNALPSIADPASLSLVGKSSTLRAPQSMSRLTKAPRFIPGYSAHSTNRDVMPLDDNQSLSASEDDWGGRIPLVELQLFHDPPKVPKAVAPCLANGQPLKHHVTMLEERPFHKAFDATQVFDHLPQQTAMGLVGTRLHRDQHAQSMPALLPPQVQAFANKPMDDAVKQAYAAIYPHTYHTTDTCPAPTSTKTHDQSNANASTSTTSVVAGVALDRSVAPVVHPVPSPQRFARGRDVKSKDVCFWQAVEGFKSIQDMPTKGAAFQLPPAKLRRLRRAAEIYDEFLRHDSPQVLAWLLRDHPATVQAIETQVAAGDVAVNRVLFDAAQRLVECRMKQQRRKEHQHGTTE
ncbi:hypothetical protein DYB32_001347 [Aphanomyces invadans]|uniref:RGS domain-containing protein n=1 Tax=Aphanomyces invadans TaxID=157072 RepID=A0A3R6ZWE9_9STRA|nr:hypothetical protein DYB32_001347 [Aphanomyces invadans]